MTEQILRLKVMNMEQKKISYEKNHVSVKDCGYISR